MKIILALAAVLLVAGCGETTDGGSGGAEPRSSEDLLRTRGLVLVLDAGGGAMLCTGPVATSLPPQCTGPRLVGWDWTDHEGDFETAAKVRWGSFALTGTYDETAFTPTEVIPEATYDEPPPEDPYEPPGTPCSEPDGGWRVLDPERTTEATMNATFQTASRLDDYADAWVDQSINPLYAEGEGPEWESGMNDPTKLIVNVRVTEDPAPAEAALREVWGGALCVSQARWTDAELERVQRELSHAEGVQGSSRSGDGVDVEVFYDDGSLQASLDEKYGDGVVKVYSSLVPAR